MSRVAITGASGYLGSRLCARFASLGWDVVKLVRSPRAGHPDERRYVIDEPSAHGLLDAVEVLIHTAYDFSLTSKSDIWRVNVAGTKRLLDAAVTAGVGKMIVLSTMSAYTGTTQLYGSAKLAIESETLAAGGCVVRPGIVYGDGAGGMVGALRRMTRLPVVPLIVGASSLYPVHEDDLVSAIVALATHHSVLKGPIGVAQPDPVPFSRLMEGLARAEGRRCRFVPVPWQLVYGTLRAGEALHIQLPFRADSLLGLVRPAPSVPGQDDLARLGVRLRRFPAESRAASAVSNAQ